jgi:anti-sigma factor RsiW
MANCRDLEPQLTAYVDGEVDEAERHRLETHLQRCGPCRSRVASERATHDLLAAKRDLLRGCAPASLRHRCVAQRAIGAGATGVLGRRVLVPLSVAASLVVAAALFFMFGWGSSVETYAAQLADDHVQCFRSPPAAAAVDAGALAQSWQSSNGWALKVAPGSEKEGLQLLAVRRCGSPRGHVAHVLYRWWDEPLSVYVLNGTVDDGVEGAGDPRAHETIVTRGERAVIWTSHGRTYAVVARSQAAEIERVAEYIRTSTE